jgi:hypothetical protein
MPKYIDNSYTNDENNNGIVYPFYIIAGEHPSNLNCYRFHYINDKEEEIEFEEIEDKNKYISLVYIILYDNKYNIFGIIEKIEIKGTTKFKEYNGIVVLYDKKILIIKTIQIMKLIKDINGDFTCIAFKTFEQKKENYVTVALTKKEKIYFHPNNYKIKECNNYNHYQKFISLTYNNNVQRMFITENYVKYNEKNINYIFLLVIIFFLTIITILKLFLKF